MQKSIAISTVLILLLVIALARFKNRVEVEGSLIRIDSGPHHIEGTLDPESTLELILKDAGASITTFAGDAFVRVLPLKTADQLRAQFGDFFKCGSPGAIQSLQSRRSLVLVSDGPQTRAAITEAITLIKASFVPVVSLSGSRIQVTKLTTLKWDVMDDPHAIIFYYYVRDLKVIRPDYLN